MANIDGSRARVTSARYAGDVEGTGATHGYRSRNLTLCGLAATHIPRGVFYGDQVGDCSKCSVRLAELDEAQSRTNARRHRMREERAGSAVPWSVDHMFVNIYGSPIYDGSCRHDPPHTRIVRRLQHEPPAHDDTFGRRANVVRELPVSCDFLDVGFGDGVFDTLNVRFDLLIDEYEEEFVRPSTALKVAAALDDVADHGRHRTATGLHPGEKYSGLLQEEIRQVARFLRKGADEGCGTWFNL